MLDPRPLGVLHAILPAALCHVLLEKVFKAHNGSGRCRRGWEAGLRELCSVLSVGGLVFEKRKNVNKKEKENASVLSCVYFCLRWGTFAHVLERSSMERGRKKKKTR